LRSKWLMPGFQLASGPVMAGSAQHCELKQSTRPHRPRAGLLVLRPSHQSARVWRLNRFLGSKVGFWNFLAQALVVARLQKFGGTMHMYSSFHRPNAMLIAWLYISNQLGKAENSKIRCLLQTATFTFGHVNSEPIRMATAQYHHVQWK
jgi:hypothetical protein